MLSISSPRKVEMGLVLSKMPDINGELTLLV
jgi:hypothetical protein